MPTPYDRLKRWRDTGDGPVGYTAGNGNFGADVSAVLDELHDLRDALGELVEAVEVKASARANPEKYYSPRMEAAMSAARRLID